MIHQDHLVHGGLRPSRKRTMRTLEIQDRGQTENGGLPKSEFHSIPHSPFRRILQWNLFLAVGGERRIFERHRPVGFKVIASIHSDEGQMLSGEVGHQADVGMVRVGSQSADCHLISQAQQKNPRSIHPQQIFRR